MKKALFSTLTIALLVGSPLVLKADDSKKDAKPYPLTTCIISGDKLGEMGKPPSIVYKGQEIKFCCKDCIKDFKKDPEKFMKKLAAEEKKEAAKADKK